MYSFFKNLWKLIVGLPRNPFNPDTQRHIALIAFLAWVGLGADGLSSSCYGPEEAFSALGTHTALALYLAIATAVTVFVISLAYNQVIELFPSGGGGYKIASELLGPHAGLISGAALIVDYVLTISISIASGMDALFSLFPHHFIHYKLFAEIGMIALLIVLNLRGMKESIKFLLPIFLGFMVTHLGIILYGVFAHKNTLPEIFSATIQETHNLSKDVGWFFILALLLRAYSLGSGTYTGIEAVSNNVNRLAEPRVRTGKWTMFYMAVSLSFTAGGIILLYLLWNAHPVAGQTLNAIVFHSILGNSKTGNFILLVTLALEAGLLFAAGNTGFLAGPSVLANMAVDGWLPNRFRHLSSRLVTQNGVVVFGLAALCILIWSEGSVAWLVVLYSINVFLTFSLSILGLCVYWGTHRQTASPYWIGRFLFSIFAFCITASILFITLFSKFTEGGWVTSVVTGAVIALCLLIKRHYGRVTLKLQEIDGQLIEPMSAKHVSAPPLDPTQATAVLLVSNNYGIGIHTLLWIQRMFPNHFKNFIFLSAGVVDVESFRGNETMESMKERVNKTLNYFVQYCHQHHLAAKSMITFGTDPVLQLTELAQKIILEFPNSIFFATRLTFEHDNWLTRLLHNETSIALQRKLHARGMQLVILPMRV